LIRAGLKGFADKYVKVNSYSTVRRRQC